MRIGLFFLLTLLPFFVHAQICTTPGQNPSTAFPVCGTSTFAQTTVPLCGGRNLPYKGCGTGNLLQDVNPFWYKFTCFKSGTLGFTITPNNLSSDYDWELYDITGKYPDDIYQDADLVISNNWSGETGVTGTSNAGIRLFVCYGPGQPLFSKMPELKEGHNYLLLVSHFTRSQSGYSLSFGGGTAVITDAGTPQLKEVLANCGGNKLGLKLSKNIKCSSIANNASDFYVMPGNIAVSQVKGFGCTTGFDADSLELTLPQPLAAGDYTLHIKKGSDNNTLLDYCDNAIPEDDKLTFQILPRAPSHFDSLGTLKCAPKQLKVYMDKFVLCSSIAPDGSDFMIQGTHPVTITSATASCNTGTAKEVILTFSKPIEQEGAFEVILKKGTDGNTILDECGEETPEGDALAFNTKDTVSALFTYEIQYGCSEDVIQFSHERKNGVNTWSWNLDDGKQSNLQNPVGRYTLFNQKNISLVVSNGFCSDTSTQSIVLENYLKADFTVIEDNCPNEPIPFKSHPEGKIVSHHWDFGDGSTSDLAEPEHIFNVQRETVFPVKYTVTDQWGCQKMVQKNVKVYTSCYLAVPNAFSPNNDGLNDMLAPLNAIKADKLKFSVYNRWGQKVFETSDWKKGWNGKVDGKDQPAAVYIWVLQYTNRDTQKQVEQKGTVTLIR